MDRRTLFFIFAMTVIFFLMNQWFNHGIKTDKTLSISSPKTQIVFSGEDKPSAPLNETSKEKYNIKKLFADFELTEFLANGIFQKDTFLSISPEKDLPEVAYLQTEYANIKTTLRLQLVVKPKKTGDPFLYSVYPLSKLETPWIPDESTFPIKLIYFEEKNVYSIDGEAAGFDKLIFDYRPPKNGIILFSFKNLNAPYAYYDEEKNQISYLDQDPAFENYSLLIYPEEEIKTVEKERKQQNFYILENKYMQLVFTNINGAISEINLPFVSERNPNSVVREIGIDRIMQKDYPYNDRFPQFESYLSNGRESPKKIHPQTGGYYPLLRRDIIGSVGDATVNINPHYYAFNLVEKNQPISETIYTLKRFEKNLIEFESVQGNRRISKIFSLPSDPDEAPYTLDLTIKVDGDARNLFLTLGIPEVELISGSFNPSLKYRTTRNQKIKIEEIKVPKELVSFSNVVADWYCNSNGFFGIILDPIKKVTPGLSVHPVPGEITPSRITVIDAEHQLYPVSKYPGYGIHAPIPAKSGVTNFRIFAGPFDKNILERVDQTFSNPATGYNPDYVGAKSYHGWFSFISQPFAKFLFVIMNFFHSITHSWGFSIILLTVVLRLMLFPLNNWSMKSTAKLQKVSPKVQAIQEKYKKDPKRAQMEIMNLYRQEGANPFGGCLPMLIQLPFLFGMFDLLKSSFELRGAPFIPGWINNLTAPDVLFSWDYPIPFVGTSFHLLPIFLGVIMYFQQKFMSSASKTQSVSDQQKQTRMMGNVMTIVFTVLFYHFPSGLNIYWISSMLLGIVQQWWVNKQMLSKGK